MSAPAENLVCPIVGGSHDEYSFTSGWTSGAAALVTGLCGMIISVHPDLTPEEVEYILKSTADPIDHLPGNSLYIGRLGAGRINAYRAVLCSKKLSEPIILSGGISGSYEKYHVNITHGVSTGDINIKTKDLTINGPFEAGLNNSLIIDNDFIINCN